LCLTAPTWSTITLIAWATMSWSSRAIRARWAVTLLVAFAGVFAMHPPPVGPAGLACFAAAAVLIERVRARDAHAVALPPTSAGPVPAGTTV